MLARLHLVRHGEVLNPDGVVYSDLPGFPLSPLGRTQAAAAAEHLASSGASLLGTSPLQRATETAAFISDRLGLEPVVLPGLTEWGLSLHWSGIPWHLLDDRFPGELAAYFAHPFDMPFSQESLDALAIRMGEVVEHLGQYHPGATVVLVSHQDPIQALRFHLLGRGWEEFHHGKPGHAAVITLDNTGGTWSESAVWQPEAGAAFPPPQD